MRITDLATPATTAPSAARADGPRRTGGDTRASVLASAPRDAGHPDEVAATALARAAHHAHSGRLVSAANQAAADSVRGALLDPALVP